MAYSPYGRTIWQHQGILQGAGNASSGPIDIHDATDLWLDAYVPSAPSGTAPTLNVWLDALDAFGNIFASLLALTQLNGLTFKAQGSIGVHIPGAGSLALPTQCQVTWSVGGTNPVFTGAAISLAGR